MDRSGDGDYYNEEDISRNAVKLQNELAKLKLDIIKAKAQHKVQLSTVPGENNTLADDDGDLYGPDANKVSEELNKLTKERTQTFLNFTSLQAALKAAHANKAITRALHLEKDGNIDLEKEEEEHVRSLLDEQKELTLEVLKQHEEGVEQELEIIKARLELARLYTRYAEVIGDVVDKRRALGSGNWEKDTVKAYETLKIGDYKINQMRFMIQKFMLSFNKFGLQFNDDAMNERYKALLLRCGKTPEEMRKMMGEGENQDAEMRLAPPAAGDLAQ